MKKRKMNFPKAVILFSTVGLALLLTPMVIFITYFNSQEISDKISLWGAFGDFFGGTLNTILSLISLIVLGYITFLIHKMSSIENKNLFLFQKKIDAFEELAKQIPQLNTIPKHLTLSVITSKNLYEIGQVDNKILNTYVSDLVDQVKIYHQYHYFLFNFNARYNHLFNYDFTGQPYKDLIESSDTLGEQFDEYLNKISQKEFPEEDLQEYLDEHTKHLANFVNALKEELE
jgi:hypothetical protein